MSRIADALEKARREPKPTPRRAPAPPAPLALRAIDEVAVPWDIRDSGATVPSHTPNAEPQHQPTRSPLRAVESAAPAPPAPPAPAAVETQEAAPPPPAMDDARSDALDETVGQPAQGSTPDPASRPVLTPRAPLPRFRSEDAGALADTILAGAASRRVLFMSAGERSPSAGLLVKVATALARRAQRDVLVLDVNFGTPGFDARFGLTGAAGIADALVDDVALKTHATQLSPGGKLWVCPAGRKVADMRRVLRTPEASPRLRALFDEFGFVLARGGAVLDDPDLRPVGAAFDGLVIVTGTDAGDDGMAWLPEGTGAGGANLLATIHE